MSRLSEVVTALEDNASDEIGSLQNKLLRGMKRAKKSAGKKRFQGLKRGFTKTILRQQSTIEIVIEKPGETTIVKDQTSVEVLDIPDTEPTLPTDVMEVWFSGCHSGERPQVLFLQILFEHNMSRRRWRKCRELCQSLVGANHSSLDG